MSNIRKNFLENNILRKLLNGSFLFEDEDLNKAEKIIIKEVDHEEIKRRELEDRIKREGEIRAEIEKNAERVLILESEELLTEKVKVVSSKKLELEVNKKTDRPTGYIDLELINLTANELFLKHNITLQYLDINGKKYIKEIRLGNQGRELDCYSDGENKSLTMEKISSTQLIMTLVESDDNIEKMVVINGRIIS